MKEEMLEAIYGTVERLEQKVDELSASTKKTETGAIPVPVNVDTSKLEKDAKEIWSGKKVTEGTEEVENHGCVLYQMKRI